MNTDFARQQMVEQQIRTWDVFEPSVLRAFSEIEKERFVPEGYENVAYADTEIPLPHGQFMLRGNLVGRILQALRIRETDRALEIGTGTGYLTACLAFLAASVTSIDIFPDFVAEAQSHLDDLGIDNASLACMDATVSLPDGKFDVIAVTASMPEFDDRLEAALAEGGRLFVVVGDAPVMQAMLITKQDGRTKTEYLFETNVPPLVASSRPREFAF